MNKAIIIGNVGRSPEIKTLPSGVTLAKFSVATTDRWHKDENGDPTTDWHNIVAFGKLADIIAQYVGKGSKVAIEGKIQTRSYQKEGEESKRYSTEIIADQLEMLSPKSDSGGVVASDQINEDDDVPF